MSAPSATLDTLRTRLAALESEVSTYGPRSVPAELRRDHVLTAATVAFIADGFEGASMQRIAEAAGVTKPVVYSLFGSKQDLFAAVVDRESDDMTMRIGAALPREGESPLRAGICAYLRYDEERRALWGPILAATQHRPVAVAALRLRDRQVDLVATSILGGYRDLDLRPDTREVEALAHLVIGATQSVAAWWHGHPELSLDAVADFLEAALGPSLEAVRVGRAAAASFADGPDPERA